jgi:hypothetical protein
LSNLVLTNTKAERYSNFIGDSCDETEVSAKDVRHRLSTGRFLELDDSDHKWEMLCFSYKIGLINKNGMIIDDFSKDILSRAADEVEDICLDESNVEPKENRNQILLMCLRDNLPVFSSFL